MSEQMGTRSAVAEWAEQTPPTNGKAPPPRRQPIRTTDGELEGDYAGWTARFRTNPRSSLLDEFGSGDFERVRAALAEVVLDWNYVDEEGAPIACTPAAVHALPTDLLAATVEAFGRVLKAASDVPKGSGASSGIS
jgi:hypothetical protein